MLSFDAVPRAAARERDRISRTNVRRAKEIMFDEARIEFVVAQWSAAARDRSKFVFSTFNYTAGFPWI